MTIFDSFSQETRLEAFRLLVQAGPEGLAAGALSKALGTPHNTLSFHLTHLSNAGVISARKRGRSIIYSANFEVMHDLIGYLARDCCSAEFTRIRKDRDNGDAVIELRKCCAPAETMTYEKG